MRRRSYVHNGYAFDHEVMKIYLRNTRMHVLYTRYKKRTKLREQNAFSSHLFSSMIDKRRRMQFV